MDDETIRKEKEDDQVRKFLQSTTDKLEQKNEELSNENKVLREKFYENEKELRETKQLELFSQIDVLREQNSATRNKKIAIAAVAAIAITVAIFATDPFGVENEVLKSGYVISNLRGDTVDTWLTWRLAESGQPMHVTIQNAEQYSPEKIQVIYDALLSDDIEVKYNESIDQEEILYYGWQSALQQISSEQTKFNIPGRIIVQESDLNEGQIIIKLTNLRNVDGFAGWTKSIADDEYNQILKSEITIYEVDKLTDEELAKLVRHEFGHALGLGHSTASNDLMYETINMELPLISQCDIQVIEELYDGSENSRVFCET